MNSFKLILVLMFMLLLMLLLVLVVIAENVIVYLQKEFVSKLLRMDTDL